MRPNKQYTVHFLLTDTSHEHFELVLAFLYSCYLILCKTDINHLNEVFVISRIIKVEVGVISRRLRLLTLAEALIILDITKTESNNCFIMH